MAEPWTHDWSDELDGIPAVRRSRLLDALARALRDGGDTSWLGRVLAREWIRRDGGDEPGDWA